MQDGIKIVTVPRWLMPFGYGLTIYKTIFVREDANREVVIAHEYCHTQQWNKIGLLKFPFKYLIELIKSGYLDNKYEVEARKYADTHYRKFIGL